MRFDPTHRHRRERAALVLIVLMVVALAAGWSWTERRQALGQESARLETLGAALEANLARLLNGTLAGLRAVRRETANWAPEERVAFVERRMAALRGTMSGVLVMEWRDAEGRLRGDSTPGTADEVREPGAAFEMARARPDPLRWLAAPPRAAAPGRWVLDFALPLVDAQGRFDGALLVCLDRSYFEDLLAAVLYAPDMRAAVLHGAGRVAVSVPQDPRAEGEDAARPDSPLSRHLASGRPASIQQALSAVQPVPVLVAFRTLRGEGLGMEPPLVLAVSRGVDEILAPWRLQTAWLMAALAAASAAAFLTLRGAQRRRAGEAADAERLRLALSGGDLALWDLDIVTDRSVVNERWSTMLGYQPGEITADDAGWRGLVHPDDRERVVALQEAHLAGRSEAFEATYRIRHRDGHYLWILDRGRVLARAPDGRPLRMVGTHMDVTAAVEAEAAQRAAQDELAATLAAVPDLLFDIDADGLVVGMHAPRAELLVLPPDRQVGRQVSETLPAEAAAMVMRVLHEALRNGHASGAPYALDLRAGRRWFELTASRRSVPPGEKPRCILLARDVTDRVLGEEQRATLERQVREAQRIESLGTLAGGIAHDFNNILAAILGNASLARDALPQAHPALASLDRIHKAGLRARSLVQQILTFSRRDPAALHAQPLKPVVEETVALLRATLPATVRLVVVVSESPLIVEADATQLQQVLMNLCTNAWHALPEGRGRIEIGLAEVPGDPEAAPTDLRAQRHAHLWVSDDGSGMDSAIRERLFDPFFTTKPVGQGTGLGLSVAHGIVRGHGGSISVDTAPGQGSTFHVRLPLAEAAAALQPDAGGPAAAPAPGIGRHVLVLDDDEVMALTAQALLERAGWRVTRCHAAAEALNLLGEGGPRFDVVVSDYNMPDMSGTEFAVRARQLQPGLPIVISSGFVSDELRRQAEAAGVRGLLHKEHTLERLAALADEVARGAAEGGS